MINDYPRVREVKEYNYIDWIEHKSHTNKLGDCTRLIKATTKKKQTHWIVITYNQRFWSRASYHFYEPKYARDKFKFEKDKIDSRAVKLKKPKRGFGQ